MMNDTPPRKRVLLVDDEPEILHLMELSLQTLPLEVITASDGQAALEWLHQHEPPDLVVLDVMMPRTSGPAVYEQMQADERLKDVAVMIVSVVYPDETLIRNSTLHRLPMLRKPFSPLIFAERVQELLEGSAPAPLF